MPGIIIRQKLYHNGFDAFKCYRYQYPMFLDHIKKILLLDYEKNSFETMHLVSGWELFVMLYDLNQMTISLTKVIWKDSLTTDVISDCQKSQLSEVFWNQMVKNFRYYEK